eukprot:m.134735 g.134735  ORF g.134735 m.134735 type:complete len:283 (+) comp13963_c0_seq1:360-1208(+)
MIQKRGLFLLAAVIVGLLSSCHAQDQPQTTAPVKVLVVDYLDATHAIVGATVTWLEQNVNFTVPANGTIEFQAPVGANVTMNMPAVMVGQKGYHQVQSTTVVVPLEGLTKELDMIVLQCPSEFIYKMFSTVTPHKKDENKCQLVVTVCAQGKGIFSHPQGLPNTTTHLSPANEEYTYYFGTWGKYSNATNPLPNNLNSTSWDGGVLFMNIPVSETDWYTVSAHHAGFTFSQSHFRCSQPGLFINGAPNQGPRATSASVAWLKRLAQAEREFLLAETSEHTHI